MQGGNRTIIDEMLARYTTREYNDYGWVAVNKVLTGKELKKLYSQFAKVKLNKEQNFKNKLGEYLIPVGDRYGSVDKIVYIKGTNKHPIIRQIVEINKPFRGKAENIIVEVMDYEKTGLYYDAFEIYESYARAEVFTVHKAINYPSYSELKRGTRGQDGKRTNNNDRERNNGTRVSKTRTGEVRGNDGEVSYSDIDSEGNELSKEQIEYFKDSKVRDKNGNLLVVYHGTYEDFTIFDITKTASANAFGKGHYFTSQKSDDIADISKIRERIVANEFEQKLSPYEAINSYYGEEYLEFHRKRDYVTFREYQDSLREGTGSRKVHTVSEELQDGTRGIRGGQESGRADVSYSDIDELDNLNAQLREKQNQIYSASMELRKYDAKAEEEKLYAVLQKDGATREELDKALQEYSNWGKESGYAEAFERQSALKDEEKLLRREIQKVEDRLHDELKEQIAHWDDEDVKKYVAKAVRKYHTTTRLENASYLVTTGSMLDFSEGQGYRVKDHREISEILDLPDYAEYSDGMIAFMNMGNIRLQTYGIDVSAMPNDKQFSTLRDIIFKVMRENDEFSVDFSKTDGNSAGSVTYGKGTSTSKIVADIKSYFETGVVPEEQSSIRDFLYSDIDAEVDIYEVLGENKRLQKENKKLHEDFDRLMERLNLERQLTHGNHFNKNQLDAVAGHIRNIANSSYSKTELVKKLDEVYTYLATSKEVTWDDLFARLYGIAEDVLKEAKTTVYRVFGEHNKELLKPYIEQVIAEYLKNNA